MLIVSPVVKAMRMIINGSSPQWTDNFTSSYLPMQRALVPIGVYRGIGTHPAAYLNRLRKKSPTLRIPLRRVSTTGFTGCRGQVSFGAVPVR
jgi:hypothetical protein